MRHQLVVEVARRVHKVRHLAVELRVDEIEDRPDGRLAPAVAAEVALHAECADAVCVLQLGARSRRELRVVAIRKDAVGARSSKLPRGSKPDATGAASHHRRTALRRLAAADAAGPRNRQRPKP
eukprot:5075536-Prymnesium_polylepis.1